VRFRTCARFMSLDLLHASSWYGSRPDDVHVCKLPNPIIVALSLNANCNQQHPLALCRSQIANRDMYGCWLPVQRRTVKWVMMVGVKAGYAFRHHVQIIAFVRATAVMNLGFKVNFWRYLPMII